MLHSPIPADGWGKELPTQMLHSIGLKGFWTYYWNTGDRKTLGEVYFGTLKYLDLWELDERGLTVPREGEWRWIDWGDKKDELALYSAWHALALLGVEEMAELFGDEKRAAQCRADYERIKAAFQKEYWKGTWFKSEFVEEPDDRANGLAVVAGLADPEHFPGILSVLNSVQNSSPYMERYVLDALFMMGEHEAAYDRMKDRYGPLVDNDLTSLPEFWVPEHGSVNHAWSGGPLTLIGEYICGITAIEPGWTRFQVNPSPGSISRFDTVVPSISGDILVLLDNGELTVEVPNGTTAEVWASSALSDGAVELRKEKARTVFECGPGVWRFQL